MIDDYKVKVIDDMLSRIEQEECYCAKLTAGGSHTIDIDVTALNLLKDYFSGQLEYTPATTFTTDVRKMNTTQLFNYIHDEHKEEFAPDGNSSWLIKFCEVSGISRAEAEACYWRNEPIKENPEANRKVIEFMLAEGII